MHTRAVNFEIRPKKSASETVAQVKVDKTFRAASYRQATTRERTLNMSAGRKFQVERPSYKSRSYS